MNQNSFSNYNGFINIYKEAGYTSMDVCAKLRGILRMRKIGHAGTLDPMAEGVLPVALGRATKDVDRIGDGTKTYRAGMLLGTVTNTQDTSGTVLSKTPFEGRRLPDGTELSDERIREAIESFVGSYEQLTPMYSARKVNGKKLYEYARAGKEVERKRKEVGILSVSIGKISFPRVEFTVSCTKGTYIRTLCHDIGEKLSCGACMDSLLRTQVGDFVLSDAVKLSEVERLRDEKRVDELLFVKSPTVVALGKFDGTHKGHQKLFAELRKLAQAERLKSCVLVLNGNGQQLKDGGERREMLYRLGIDYVLELTLTETLKRMPAEDFLREILLKKLCMKHIVAGPDVSFGYKAQGNAALLETLSGTYGYGVTVIDKLQLSDSPERACPETVSSSRIRSALEKGEMQTAARLLGEPYSFSGEVVHGRHLGSSVLGFPTMNLLLDQKRQLPPLGVYAARLRFYDEKGVLEPAVYEGIANLGRKPTVETEAADYDRERIELETNLFSYDGDAYGRRVRVELCEFIRPERKFESLSALREQLCRTDVAKARTFFEKELA